MTAERREASLQRTPISVAAFNEETMELKGLETIEDIATVTPNFDIKGSRGRGNIDPEYQVRGLAGGGARGERSVAMYIDGIFMPRTTGPFLSVLDLERIEVLRGPQGTLFGRNSTGGAIRVFTKQPGPERDGYVRLTAGDFDRQDISAMINVPLGDSVYFRAHGGSLSQDGYVTRGSQELGGSEDSLGRLQLAIEPSDTFRVTFGLSATKSESDGNPQDLETFDMNPSILEGSRGDWVSDFLAAAGQPRLAVNDDPRILLDDFTMPDWCFLDDTDPDWDAACEQINESDYQQFDVNLTWDLNDRWAFTSITGLSDFESHGISDWVMLGTERRHNDSESDVVYQELQLNATFDRFDLVTGLSYFQEDVYGSPGTGGPNYDRRSTSTFEPQAANGNAPRPGGTGPNGLFIAAFTDGAFDSQSLGAFANVTWHITDRLNLTPGVRYALDEKDVTETRFPASDFVPTDGLPRTISASDDWDNTDWRLTLDYAISPDHMLYVTSSEAFRSGAYSYAIGTTPGDTQTALIAAGTLAAFTPPERVQNDEIGARTEWLDGRLRVNLTYFDMAYTDRQGPIQVLDPSLPTGFRIELTNTGDVDFSGYELEGQIAATDNFMIDFSAGFIDYTLDNPCANNGDFLGPSPAEDSYSLGGRWMKPLERGGGLTFGLSYAYTGPQHTHSGGTAIPCFNANGTPNTTANIGLFDSRYELPDYALLNGRVRYTSASGNWDLTVFGNNLTDEVYGNSASRFGGAFWDTPTGVGPNASPTLALPERSALGITRGRPREYGMTFQYNFGGGAAAR